MSWFSGIKSFFMTLCNFGTIIGEREDLSDEQDDFGDGININKHYRFGNRAYAFGDPKGQSP